MSDRVRAELLREWRLAQQLDVSFVARQANLSVAQIHQLEGGGSSLFYSQAIKEAAARKVAQVLGADPEKVVALDVGDSDAALTSVPAFSVVDELVALQRRQGQQPPTYVWRRKTGWGIGALLLLACVVWGAIVARQASPSLAVAATTLKPATAVQPVVVPAVEPGRSVADAKAPAAGASVAVTSAALCQQPVTAAPLSPKSPRKAGDMVYIVAQKSGAVCVQDGAGKMTVLALQAQEAQSVYGSAPWRVYFEQAAQAQLFFQGERLHWPDAQVTAVALQEAVRMP